MRRLLFISVVVLFHVSAQADKFINTGPGTIHTCDTLTHVIIGAPEGDPYFAGMQLTLGNSTEWSGQGGSMQIMGPKDGSSVGSFLVGAIGYNDAPALQIHGGAGHMYWMLANWDLYTGLLYANMGIETPFITVWDVQSYGEIRADGEIQSAVGFRANGTALNVPDFVFEPGYKLRSLEETERFVKANRHLPEVPSAAEIKKEGMNLAEMNLKLLQKVEELTLHAIEQEKRLTALEARLVSR